MGFLLAVIGALLLLLSLAGIAFGSFMSLNHRTREPGVYFVLWWIPALAAAIGILAGDSVTFAIGTFCFVVAGAAFTLERRSSHRPARGGRTRSRDAEKPPPYEGAQRRSSEKTKHPLSERAKQLSGRTKRWLSKRSRTRK
jgi:hypothetical protein